MTEKEINQLRAIIDLGITAKELELDKISNIPLNTRIAELISAGIFSAIKYINK